eukprot:g662.t1
MICARNEETRSLFKKKSKTDEARCFSVYICGDEGVCLYSQSARVMSSSESILSCLESGGCDVYYGENFGADKLAMFELTPEMETLMFSGKETLCFKGALGKNMVACTSSQTFEVRRVESSNTTLLAPLKLGHDDEDVENETKKRKRGSALNVSTTTSRYYEFELVHPCVRSLWKFVSARPFSFDRAGEEGKSREEEDEDAQTKSADGDRPTFRDLNASVQASENEIRTFLARCGAFEVDGRWSIPDTKCVREAFDHLVYAFDENQWTMDAFPSKEWIESFSKLGDARRRRNIARFVSESILVEGSSCRIEFRKMARLRASMILQENEDKVWRASDFLSEWESRLPELEYASSGVRAKVKIDWLEGIVLNVRTAHSGDTKEGDLQFRKFPLEIHELEPRASERFVQLFNIQAEWTLDDMRPFFDDLTQTQTESNLLAKHTRSYMRGDQRVFCRR